MRSRASDIFMYAMVSVAALLSLSCSKERDGLAVDETLRTIQVNVSAVMQSKAALEDGTAEENAIRSLRVYTFVDGRAAGYHYQASPVSERFLMDLTLYEVDGAGEQKVDFYIIANEESMRMDESLPALSETTSSDELEKLRFTALDTSNGFPMYYAGTVSVNMVAVRDMTALDASVDKKGHEEHSLLQQTLSFELVRPLAKLAVFAAKKSSDVEVIVKGIEMLARGTRQYNYLLPQDESVLASLVSRPNNRVLLESGSDVSVEKVLSYSTEQEADYTQIVSQTYLSEVPVGAASSQEWNVPNDYDSVVLHLTYSLGEGSELRNAYIYMPPIERNTFYKVFCLISGEGQIIVNYYVKKWDVAENSTITFDYPTHSYLLPALPTTDNPDPVPAATPVMTVDKPFEAWFRMLYPAGQTWMPTIVKLIVPEGVAPSEDDYGLEVFSTVDGVNLSEALTPDKYVADDTGTVYLIRITPRNPANVGVRVVLGITYTPTGFTYSDYLLINGSQSKIFWPSSGNDPSALEILQEDDYSGD